MSGSKHNERWDRIVNLFNAASEMSNADRSVFLQQECDDDLEMLSEVQELLACHESDQDRRLDLTAATCVATQHTNFAADASGTQGIHIGPYRVEELIGRGGSSNVYRATRISEFEQTVAIKVLRGEFWLGKTAQQRFEIERQILADLNHESIAQIIDGGNDPLGCPYLVMEHVSQGTLTEYASTRRLTVRQRVELFRCICDAVAHAHRLGVLHRDIKPNNILVNSRGVPKLVDFGIAKLTNKAVADGNLNLTRTGLLPFTPNYASPEQILGEPVGMESDVYSLGVVLYELLTGQRPYSVTSINPEQIKRVVCEETPTRPSVAVKSVRLESTRTANSDPGAPVCLGQSAGRRSEFTRLARQLMPLDSIVMMALRKDATRRYRSASDMAEDLGRYLRGEPIHASHESWSYRTWSIFRRHATLLLSISVVFVSLASGLILSSYAWQQQKSAARRLQQQNYISDMQLGLAAVENRDTQLAREIYERNAYAASHHEAGPELDVLEQLSRLPTAKALSGHQGSVVELALVPGKPWIVSIGDDDRIIVWNTDTARQVMTLTGPGPFASVAVSGDGHYLAAGQEVSHTPDSKAQVCLWDLPTAECLGVVAECDVTPESLTFSPDGQQLGIGPRYENPLFVSIPRPEDTRTIVTSPSKRSKARYRDLQFLSDGKLLTPARIYTGNQTRVQLQLWNKSLSGIERTFQSDVHLKCFALNAAKSLLVATDDYLPGLRVFDFDTGVEVCSQRVSFGSKCVAISPDGTRIALGFEDGSLKEWCVRDAGRDGFADDIETPTQRSVGLADAVTIKAHHGLVRSVEYTSSGQIVTCGDDGLVKIWPSAVRSKPASVATKEARNVHSVHTSQSGRRCVLRASDDSIFLQAKHSDQWGQVPTRGLLITTCALSTKGNYMAFGVRKRRESQVKVWETTPPYREVAELSYGSKSIRSIGFSSEDQLLAATGEDRITKIWNLKTGECRHHISHENNGLVVQFSFDDAVVACGTDREISIFECDSAAQRYSVPVLSPCVSVAWHSDSETLASGHRNGDIFLHQREADAYRTSPLKGHEDVVRDMLFLDNRLISCGPDGSMRFWHLPSRRYLGRVKFDSLLDDESHTEVVGLVESRRDPSVLAITSNETHGGRIFRLPLASR